MANDQTRNKTKPLMGTDEATIDDKGRILVSKKKRERLGEDFVLAIGATGCLVAYPAESWDALYDEIMAFPAISHGREQYQRLIVGNAEDDLKFDAQGRVVIPQKFREAAKLTDKVVLVGLGDRLEIWAKQEYEEYLKYPEIYGKERRQAIEKAFAQMLQSKVGLGA